MNEWMRDSRDVDAREGAKERTKARGMSTAAARALAAVVDAGRDGAYRDRGWERERRGLDAWMHAWMHEWTRAAAIRAMRRRGKTDDETTRCFESRRSVQERGQGTRVVPVGGGHRRRSMRGRGGVERVGGVADYGVRDSLRRGAVANDRGER